MKTRNTSLRNVVVALALLLGAGAAHAQDVMVDGSIGIPARGMACCY